MPSEDAKPVKKKEAEDQEADDNKSLGSILGDRRKKPTNNIASSAAKSQPRVTKVKKEETPDDSDKPLARPKKETGDDDDDKPLAKRSSTKKPDKVFLNSSFLEYHKKV